MSKVFIISNTNFNLSKTLSSKEWLKIQREYYYNEFFPYLTDNIKNNDILIHLGNFTCKSKSVDLNVLEFVQNLFHDLRAYLPVFVLQGENDELALNIIKHIRGVGLIKKPVELKLLMEQKFAMFPFGTTPNDILEYESDYAFLNFDYMNSSNKDIYISRLKKFKKCYCGFYDKNSGISNIKNLTAPYNTGGDEKRGFIVLETHTNIDKFIGNKFSPKFKNISIETEADLDISEDVFKNNYISLNINKRLLSDNKLKIEMLISSNDIINVTYSDDELIKDKEEIALSESSLTLNDMVVDYINKISSSNKEKMIAEFKTLVELNKK